MRAILLAAALVATPAHAQTDGMVEEPCEELTVPIPEPVLAYIRTLATLDQTATPLAPPPELAAYRAANAEARKKDWADLCRYRDDNEIRAAGPFTALRVVFMGDSITQSWSLSDPTLFSGGVVNRGISGQTTPQMLVRFMADVVALEPRAVHIMAGTNDVAGNTGPNAESDYQNNIRAMVTLAKANGIRVILGSILPTSGFTWKPGIKPVPQIRALNAWLKDLANEEGATFIDYYAALAETDGAMKRTLTFDGVHPNKAGYAAMAPLARAAIKDF